MSATNRKRGRPSKLSAVAREQCIEVARAQGAPQAAKAFGISKATVLRWLKSDDAAPPSNVPRGTSTTTPPLKSTRPPRSLRDPSERFIQEPTEERSSEADFAHVGANGSRVEEVEAERLGEDPPPPLADDQAGESFTPEVLADMLEALTCVVGFVIATSNKAPFTDELAKRCKFEPGEKRMLAATAKPACDQLNSILGDSPWIGLALFGVAAVGIAGRRLVAVDLATKPVEPDKQSTPLV